ncbi:DAK2 domain-containing protein [Lactococcus kimchii]|uniref:DAK2 domain-containing protein n=1 Tax=Lactococcus sp. S-13 TaxID=2507158 RepID=UPI0010233D41|nr:DegV family protein [Lactococcus sp. S-13]RZI49402.1 DegV family EDD domain-containing protein [Lactococcus sp. S-13]
MSQKIESQKLFYSILGGANEVILKKEELNRINVFPVADGDTGSNLAALMQSIINQLVPKDYSVKELLDQVAFASLVGARGNSGLIFAQYLNAVADNYAQSEDSPKGLIQSFPKAVKKAYAALLEPREGTILSVMSAWSESLAHSFEQEESFSKALIEAEIVAQQALSDTQFQLSVLKKNRLVDSGAKGFYYFISGLTRAYCSTEEHEMLSKPASFQPEFIISEHFETKEPLYRFCSEFMVTDLQEGLEFVRALLVQHGDSLVIAGNERQLKIHIHTNQPQQVLQILEDKGTIIYQKVDDMRLQYEISKNRRSPIALITDSVADLPAEFLLEHQVQLLPMNIMVGDKNFLDKLTIDSATMGLKLVQDTKMSTAQPSIQAVDALLSFLENKYEYVLVITVSSKLSGTYQLINQRIQEKNLSPEWIRVIDSRLNSVGQGLVIQQAIQLIERGYAFESLVYEIEKIINRTFIYVAVADLSAMTNSGRIPKFLGRIAQKLSLHPIVSLDAAGKARLSGLAFSQRQSMTKIRKKITRLIEQKQIDSLAIGHVCVPDTAHQWYEELGSGVNKVSYIVDSSAAIAISAGMGSVAIAGIKEEKAK